jgi:hypothetical protein
MADRKISDLTALTTPASGDFLPIVDISEAAAASKNKRITIEELMRGVPDGTAAAPGIAFETDPNTGIYRPGADQLAVATNGAARLYIASDGKVGVGTTSVNSQLHVAPSSDGDFTNGLRVSRAGDANQFGVINYSGGALNFIATDALSSNPIIRFFRSTDGTTTTETARFDSSGRLGIGTSAPSHRLHVVGGNGAGNTTIGCYGGSSAGDYGLLILGTGSTDKASINVDATTNDLRLDLRGNTGAFTFVSGPSYTERMRLDSSGRLGIGTTSPYSGLDISGQSMTVHAGLIDFRTNDNASRNMYIGANATDGQIFCYATNLKIGGPTTIFENPLVGEKARIDSSGRLLVGTSSAIAGSVDAASIVGSALTQSTGLRSVSSGGTLDLTLLGTGIVGHLYVSSVYGANAAARTNTVFFITTRQGNATVITSLNSANGSTAGSAFTITNPSGNIFRFTDTSSTVCAVSMCFVGSMTS